MRSVRRACAADVTLEALRITIDVRRSAAGARSRIETRNASV